MPSTLRQANKDEVDAFNTDLQAIIAKHGVELRAVPVFAPNNATTKFEVDAQVMLFKKIELIAKDDTAEPTTEQPVGAEATETNS